MLCIAHTPVQAERGSTRGKRAKRRLDVIVCQLKALEGKHMSETEIREVMLRCYGTWDGWGETVSMTRTKTLCGGRRGY